MKTVDRVKEEIEKSAWDDDELARQIAGGHGPALKEFDNFAAGDVRECAKLALGADGSAHPYLFT